MRFINIVKITWCAVCGKNDLFAAFNYCVESVDELFLDMVLAADELDIIDKQDISGAEIFLETHSIPIADGFDELEHEFLSGEVNRFFLREIFLDVIADSLQQMGFAKADITIDEETISACEILPSAIFFAALNAKLFESDVTKLSSLKRLSR